MTITRRALLTATAGATTLGLLGAPSRRADAAPLPPAATGSTSADRAAEGWYRTLVPELFVPPADAPAHNEVVVIGSGFGASVAALRLAQSGTRVTILERGGHWPRAPWRDIHSSDSVPDGRAFWHRRSTRTLLGTTVTTPSFGGVLDATDYAGMQVWRGAAVGGGSIVFTGALVEPEPHHFESVFGARVPFREMHETWYPRARTMLRAAPMPADIYASAPFGHSRAWDASARKAGYVPEPLDGIWNWDIVRDEVALRNRVSATIGESNFGNGNGSKRDLTYTYLKEATATGRATIHPWHVVHRIGERRGGGYTVEVSVTTPGGETVKRRTLTCDRLVLGAGSVGTSELLVRARAEGTLARLDDSVGAGWGTNGDGALMQWAVAHPGMLQAAPSASSIVDDSTGTGVRLENWATPGLQLNLAQICSLGLVIDPTRGTFRYDAARDDVVLDWPENGNEAAEEAMRAVHDRIVGANGTRSGIASVGIPGVQTWFTAHPLGGAVIGDTCDSYGRVKGHDGLYVVDGALIPGSTAAANPVLTITALAERNLAEIVRARG